MPGTVDESALVAALRAGDERVFADLVDRHAPAMLRVARGWGLERAPDGRWLDVCPACEAVLRDALAPTGPRRRGAAADGLPAGGGR